MTRQGAKAGFFDRPAVVGAMRERTRGFLRRFGGWVRTTAQRSMRPATKNRPRSAPGEPPRAHTKLLRKGVMFAYDASSRSVVVGPVRLDRGDDTPQLMEHGGRAKTQVYRRFREQGGRLAYDPGYVKVDAEYPARPYMNPAYELGLNRQAQFWRSSVRR